MRVKLLPLDDNKYFGTKLEVYKSGYSEIVLIWCDIRDRPSDRQLKQWGLDWDSPNDRNEARDLMSSGHFESEASFILAMKIATETEKETSNAS